MKGLNEELPPLSTHEAAVEANRCLFCYDAPCTHACPTHIDIPRFIKKIATGNLIGSARTILEANLLGATCARVCPVQELCEGACVLGSEHKPISIGRLQRHAMDTTQGQPLVKCAPPTAHKVAVVGSGPAGLSCAGELARRGHCVTVFEKRPLAGGLSTYGIISLREPIEASLDEVRLIESLGVRIETGAQVDALDDLRARFDDVFLGIGLGHSPVLGIPGEALIIGLPDHSRERLRRLTGDRLPIECAKLRPPRSDPQRATQTRVLRAIAKRCLAATGEANQHKRDIETWVQAICPQLLEEEGVGPISAAQLLISWSHPRRLRSDACFARLAGVAPIPASSGNTHRHRLDRGGDRQLNNAIHTVALTRARLDPQTKAYIERRVSEGKTRREAIRALKRHIARHLYRILETTSRALDNT